MRQWPTTSRNEISGSGAALRDLLRAPLLRGSLVRMARKCGKPGCRCERGERHVSLYLSARAGRRGRRMIYVPPSWEKAVTEWIERGRRLDRAIDALAQAQLEIFLKARHELPQSIMKEQREEGTMDAELIRTQIDSPLGTIHLAATPSGLAALYFDPQRAPMDARLMARFGPLPALVPDDSCELPVVLRGAIQGLRAYFSGELGALSALPLDLDGTDFQRSVWRALLHVGPGRTCTYGDIARRVRRPSASRAVGAAVGRNPVSLVVPCHRAIGASGKLTGYAGGLKRKEFLLDHEAARAARN